MHDPLTLSIEDINRSLQRFTDGAGAEATAFDLVRVVIDGRMQVTQVRILDESVPADTRHRLEEALAEALRLAQADLIRQAGEALSNREPERRP